MALQELSGGELALLEEQEGKCAAELSEQIDQLQNRWRQHEAKRRRLARELLRRSFIASPFGRLHVDLILPFLQASEALRWFGASSAAARQLSWRQDVGRRAYHLRRVATDLAPSAARAVVLGLHWPTVQTAAMDLGCPGWAALLEALGEEQELRRQGEGQPPAARDPPTLRGLKGLSVAFPAERSAASLQKWHAVEPTLARLGALLEPAPLQELVLTDLRSTDVLTAALRACGQHLRVCRASFIGPESRRKPLKLPAAGLPALQCLALRHRDFSGQRTSRQERMSVLAAPLLACLQSIREPSTLRVLVLAGIRIDGSREETAVLLRGLLAFSGLVAVSLRFSVPSTFGTLLPLHMLIQLRCAWPLLGHFTLADMSLHGFDYWPEQVTDFRQLYPHGGVPEAFEVFAHEFGRVLATEYSTAAESQWAKLPRRQRGFWAEVARRLPSMPHSEVQCRVAKLFPSGL